MRSTSRLPGRPTKLAEEHAQHLAELVKAGSPLDTAAGAAGIALCTLHRWPARGQAVAELVPVTAAYEAYLERAAAGTVARAEAEEEAVAIIRSAALSGTEQAATWLLERRRPPVWRRHYVHAEEAYPAAPAADHKARLREMLGPEVQRAG